MNNGIKISKEFILKLIYCIAIVLLFISIFFNIIHIDEDIRLSLANLYGLGDGIWSMFSYSESRDIVMLLRTISVYVMWIPLVVFIVSAVLSFILKSMKISFGMTVVTATCMLYANIAFIVILGEINVEYSSHTFIRSNSDIVSYVPMVLNIISLLIILGVITTLFILELRQKKGNETVPALTKYGTIRILTGTFSGASIESSTTVKIKDKTSIIIGRGSGSDVVIVNADRSVSKQHCEIAYDGDNERYYITDLSSYGTSIGQNTKLIKNMKTPVTAGVVVTLAGTSRITLE